MGVGLLELVGGAVDDELAELRERCPGLEEAGQRRPVVLALELEEEVADPVGVDTGVGRDLLLERREEGAPPSVRGAASSGICVSHAGSTSANPR